jgi:hypothetical protein
MPQIGQLPGESRRTTVAAEIVGQPIVLDPTLRGGGLHDHSAYRIAGLFGNG